MGRQRYHDRSGKQGQHHVNFKKNPNDDQKKAEGHVGQPSGDVGGDGGEGGGGKGCDGGKGSGGNGGGGKGGGGRQGKSRNHRGKSKRGKNRKN